MTAGAISLAIIFEGACLPFAGGLTDRIGGRKTLMLGGLVLAVGLGLLDDFFDLGFLFLGWDCFRGSDRLDRHGASRCHFLAGVSAAPRHGAWYRLGRWWCRHRIVGPGHAVD